MTLVIDAHHHLWDPAAREYPWMAAPALDPVRKRFDVDDLRARTAATGVDATVLVQTVSDAAETIGFLEVAEQSDGLIAGVVGWVDLTAPDVAASLAALDSGRFVAVRHQVQDEPDPAWLLRADVGHGLRRVADAGLVYDILVRANGLGTATAAVDAHPGLSFVLDHAAKPPIESGDLDVWRRDISALARRDNVSVKLSGLVTEADWQSWTPADLRPVVDHLLAAFGPRRVMFGSDWPVCELAATYSDVFQAARDLVADLTESERADVFGGTACRVYGLAV